MMAMIEIRDLVKRFGAFTAVDGVTFNVERGTVLGFLGPNGAGKSTTMKMLTGFLTPSAGRISVCGYDVTTRSIQAKRRIGYLPEGAPAYPDMTPAEFLGFIADARSLRGKTRRVKLAEAIERIQIGPVLHQPIDTLSKGFKRRVGLAQAILHDPDVLVLDEPTDGLDPNQKFEVRKLIQDMAREKAIIISTHILEEVESVCTRALIISRGRVLAEGRPDEKNNGWWFNDLYAESGRLDAVFRKITTGAFEAPSSGVQHKIELGKTDSETGSVCNPPQQPSPARVGVSDSAAKKKKGEKA
ncbi:ABC-2 type transport system ATP-binding protein [Azospirillaceae bacterium]